MISNIVWAFDLGQKLGYSIGKPASDLTIGGTVDLRQRHPNNGMILIEFQKTLARLLDVYGTPGLVAFEDVVSGHKGTAAAHVYGALLLSLKAWCGQRGIPYTGKTPPSIKKFATGKGNAKKEAMIEAAKKAGVNVVDDNHADAYWLLRMILKEYTPALPQGAI